MRAQTAGSSRRPAWPERPQRSGDIEVPVPVAPNRADPARQAIIIALAGILGAVAIFFLLTRALNFGSGDSSGVDIRIGDSVWQPGSTDRLSSDIDKAGPLLVSDVSGTGDRDLYLQHVGEDPNQGWTAFAARQPDQSRPCTALWEDSSRTFVDSCNGSVYPESGEGLPMFPVTISADGAIAVDLNAASREATE